METANKGDKEKCESHQADVKQKAWNKSCEEADDDTKLDALEKANKGDKEKCEKYQKEKKEKKDKKDDGKDGEKGKDAECKCGDEDDADACNKC